MVLSLKTAAKLNLSLQVVGKRPDGYHEIDSVMQSISLYDLVKLEESKKGIIISSNMLGLPTDRKNTAYRAAEVFFERVGIDSGAKIFIEKHIPIAAGLAGGSADAAAVLIGLNMLFSAGLSESDIARLAADVGSDVAFCAVGGTCRCRGRGELVEKISSLPKTHCVLVAPGIHISSKWVYDNFDLEWLMEHRMVGAHRLQTGIDIFNDLEKVVLSKYSEVGRIKKRLIDLGCLVSLMSGSGSSVFGITADRKTAENTVSALLKEFPQTWLLETVEEGVVPQV
ncbi:MAG: 4-(cytidine 5'-diphospho)-2-C-methyl-D-erythritol kinase [Candidatus Margulisiibacteriota bacterium]|nr:4-(cytidine 5'-diphospho)-2-C-methyl-D-erythritol kinase [Candidatus Margulisiibacteriota bacterium]